VPAQDAAAVGVAGPAGGEKLHPTQKGTAAERCKALLSLLRIVITNPDPLDASVDQQIHRYFGKEVAPIVPFSADEETEVSWNCRRSALGK